jgi:3-hydroxyisobutyrate dehydrogenase
VHTGGPGTGYALKLLVNALWFGQAVATAEALLLGRRAGVDLALMREVLADSAAGSAFVRHDLDALFAGDYLESFGLDHICEQLSLVTSMADAHGTPHEVADSVRRLYARALDRYGPADGELLAVKLLEERANLRLRP